MAERDAAAESAGQAPPPHANIHGGITSHGVPIDPANPLHKVRPVLPPLLLPTAALAACRRCHQPLRPRAATATAAVVAAATPPPCDLHACCCCAPCAPHLLLRLHASTFRPACVNRRGLDRDGGEVRQGSHRQQRPAGWRLTGAPGFVAHMSREGLPLTTPLCAPPQAAV